MTAPAPLAAAIEEARYVIAKWAPADMPLRDVCAVPVRTATLEALLLALDAGKRLERAEEALMHIKQGDLCVDGLRPGLYGHGMEFARRYFAEKERSMGNDMFNDEQLADAKVRADAAVLKESLTPDLGFDFVVYSREVLADKNHKDRDDLSCLAMEIMGALISSIDRLQGRLDSLHRSKVEYGVSERLKLIAAVKANAAEADRLRLALETATKERDGARAVAKAGDRLYDYAHHAPICTGNHERPCDCGLVEAVAAWDAASGGQPCGACKPEPVSDPYTLPPEVQEAAEEGRVVVTATRRVGDKDTMSFDGTTFTTVRTCCDCGVLICGGPTRCLYCAAKLPTSAPGAECTGIAASWCPVHGNCSCLRDEEGARTENRSGVDCPLHGLASNHGDADDRLAKAEAALREIARAECRLTTLGYKVTCVQAVAQYPGECLECASCIARRYFAEKEREAHIDEISTREVFRG